MTRKCIKWSEKEDQILIEAKKEGLSYKEISKKYGDKLENRTPDAMKHRVEVLRKSGLLPPFQEATQIYPEVDLSVENSFLNLLAENNQLLKNIQQQNQERNELISTIQCVLVDALVSLNDIKYSARELCGEKVRKKVTKGRLFSLFD